MYLNFLAGIKIPGELLTTLLSLPCLESFQVHLFSNFDPTDLPEMNHLTELTVTCFMKNFDYSSFCEVLKKMPNMKMLRVKIIWNDQDTLELVCQVLIVAASQNKDVILENLLGPKNQQKLKIVRKDAAPFDTQIKTLNFAVTMHNDAKFYENVKSFLSNNLQSYNVVPL